MNASRAFRVVEMFEEAVAEYTLAPYVVAVNSCSAALHLCCLWEKKQHGWMIISIPRRTYPSVMMGILNAGCRVHFRDEDWQGVYQLQPTGVWDCAKRFTHGMYLPGQTQCVSFHARKLLKIGCGGAILLDDPDAFRWYKRMRFDGRTEGIPTAKDTYDTPGYHYYMLPEQAARGLHLLESYPDYMPDQPMDLYPDLSKSPLVGGDDDAA
jgi:dTDP-4-amino-4,6-dideoxygalactose transaminase